MPINKIRLSGGDQVHFVLFYKYANDDADYKRYMNSFARRGFARRHKGQFALTPLGKRLRAWVLRNTFRRKEE